jgi:hypothetical protein
MLVSVCYAVLYIMLCMSLCAEKIVYVGCDQHACILQSHTSYCARSKAVQAQQNQLQDAHMQVLMSQTVLTRDSMLTLN